MKQIFWITSVLITWFSISSQSYAFCIYNDSPFAIDVKQWAGGKDFKSYSGTIRPGKKACCNWKNRDCNRSGRQNETLGFKIQPRLGHEKTIYDGDNSFRASSLYCGQKDEKRDNFRLIWVQAGAAISVRWTGPLDGNGRFNGYAIESNWLKVHSWNVDSTYRGAQQCFKNEKGWSPSDLF